MPALYAHLSLPHPHPLTTSLVLKVILNSATFCPQEFMHFVNARGDFIALLLANVQVLAVAGFIAEVYGSTSRLLQYFEAHSLPLRLVLLLPHSPVVCRLLCDLLSGPVDILPPDASLFLSQLCLMLDSPFPQHVLKVLCTLFDPQGTDYCERKYDFSSLLDVITPHVPSLARLLCPRENTASTRLHVVRLLASALKHGHGGFVEALRGVVDLVLDSFFLLPSQSLFHCQVFNLLERLLSLAETVPVVGELAVEIFGGRKLVERLIDLFEEEEGFNYALRRRDSTAQAMGILMLLRDVGRSGSGFMQRLGLGERWTQFCRDRLDRYAGENRVNFGQGLVEDSEEDEEFVEEDFDTETHDEFMKICADPLKLIELRIPPTSQQAVQGAVVRDPFEEVDRSINCFDPASFESLMESNASHRRFEEVWGKRPEVCGGEVPRVSLEEVGELHARRLQGIRWGDEDDPLEERTDKLLEWPSLPDVWGVFSEDIDFISPFDDVSPDVSID